MFPGSDASALQALREPPSELLQADRDERWRAKPEKLLERALVLEFSLVSGAYQLNQLHKILHLNNNKHRRINRSNKYTKERGTFDLSLTVNVSIHGPSDAKIAIASQDIKLQSGL